MSDDLSSHGGEPSSTRGKRKDSRWKRSAQVCTSCRQSKLRCDYLDRFPQPCTRCANATDARQCIVDPSYKRSSQRRRYSSPSHGESSRDGSISATSPAHLLDDAAVAAPVAAVLPPSTSHLPRLAPRVMQPTAPLPGSQSLGSVVLTNEEIVACFQEFTQHYHPFFLIISGPIEPAVCLAKSELLFWAICSVACRPRPDHPLLRARSTELVLSLNEAVRPLVGALFMATRHSVAEVQALLIFCEWPFTSSQRGDMTLSWKYSGLAIQLGLCLGLHRPHFVEEFSGRLHKSEPIDLTERSQTWAKCFIVHQTLATGLGLPSCLSDDWVTSTISQSRDNDVEWLRSLHPDISKLLRIQRFVLRMSAVLGNDAQSQSGQYEPTVAPALLALLSSELSDLERGLVPMSHIVSANFLNAKLSLHMFALQRDIAQTSSQDFISCYSTSMRMLTILAELTSNKDSLAMFWPRSIWHTLVISTLCLLKLATIQTLHPEIVPIDRNVVLQEVGRAYNIIMSRSVLSGDNAHRTATLIEFLAKKLASASSPDPAAPAFAFRARMSLGNLLFDATSQLRKARGNHYHKIPPMKPSIQETVPFELPAPSDAPGVVYDPNALMSTFEDFTFTSDMLQGVDPLSEPNYSLLSAENWADMVGDATFADLETLWKADTASA